MTSSTSVLPIHSATGVIGIRITRHVKLSYFRIPQTHTNSVLRCLIMSFTVLRWDFLRQDWNQVQTQTLNIMSSQFAVRYSKLPIILWYNLMSTLLHSSSLSSLIVVTIWVLLTFAFSSPNLSINSLGYLARFTKILSLLYLIGVQESSWAQLSYSFQILPLYTT